MMRVFKAFIDKVEIEKKWLPAIHTELSKLNANITQQTHEVSGVYRDTIASLKGLESKLENFVEVIRHFYAVESTLHKEQVKLEAAKADDLKPTEHDNWY